MKYKKKLPWYNNVLTIIITSTTKIKKSRMIQSNLLNQIVNFHSLEIFSSLRWSYTKKFKKEETTTQIQYIIELEIG